MAFTVWAPGQDRVRVRVDGADHDMTLRDGDWWYSDATGTDYAFLLGEDEEPLPDPRSRWQPEGVHGPSRVYDHGAFSWTDQSWTGRALPGGVLYELHVGTFTEGGTFDSAIERLDHLVDLGITFVEVLPVNSFDGTAGWGYDGVLWGAVHEPYGGPDGFKRFVDACHARGLAVVLDVVYNHLGPSGAYLDRFGPYFAGQNDWGPGLNLDGEGSDEVRRYVIDNALGWLRDFHVDALRLDAVHALSDRRATHLLEELAREVEALSAAVCRPLTLIAESDLNDPKLVLSREAHGYGLHAQWSDDLHHALHVALSGETSGYYADFAAPGALARTLKEVFFHAGDVVVLPRPHARAAGGHADGAGAPVPGVPAEPRPDRQPRDGRPPVGDGVPRPARVRGGDRVLLAVHADDLHGRGVGGEHAVAVLRVVPRSRAGGGGADGPHGGSSRGTGGASRRCRTRSTRRRWSGRGCAGWRWPSRGTGRCWSCTGR